MGEVQPERDYTVTIPKLGTTQVSATTRYGAFKKAMGILHLEEYSTWDLWSNTNLEIRLTSPKQAGRKRTKKRLSDNGESPET